MLREMIRWAVVPLTALALGLMPGTSRADFDVARGQGDINQLLSNAGISPSDRANLQFGVAGTISGPAAEVTGLTQAPGQAGGLTTVIRFFGARDQNGGAINLQTAARGGGVGIVNAGGNTLGFAAISEGLLATDVTTNLIAEIFQLQATNQNGATSVTVEVIGRDANNNLVTYTEDVAFGQGNGRIQVGVVATAGQRITQINLTANGGLIETKDVVDIVRGAPLVQPIPEPSTVTVGATGIAFAGLAALRRRQRARASA